MNLATTLVGNKGLLSNMGRHHLFFVCGGLEINRKKTTTQLIYLLVNEFYDMCRSELVANIF
jgi:hypothetical protein